MSVMCYSSADEDHEENPADQRRWYRRPGYSCPGPILSAIGELFIVAPEVSRERLRSQHHHCLAAARRSTFGGRRGPWVRRQRDSADCVKLAILSLLESPPDLVVSGINQGPNLGLDVLYSGTVSAAFEGVMKGVPAIAVSLARRGGGDFTFAATVAREIGAWVLLNGLPPQVVLNINVPALPAREIAGVLVTRQSTGPLHETYERRLDPACRPYFWLAGRNTSGRAVPGTGRGGRSPGLCVHYPTESRTGRPTPS